MPVKTSERNISCGVQDETQPMSGTGSIRGFPCGSGTCETGGLGVVGMALLLSFASAQTRVYIDVDQAGGDSLPLAMPQWIGEADVPQLAEPHTGRIAPGFEQFRPLSHLGSRYLY